MPKTYCPDCDAVINVDNPREGAMIKCPECDMELEIISLDPFEVDFPLDLDEDGDDDDDDDEGEGE